VCVYVYVYRVYYHNVPYALRDAFQRMCFYVCVCVCVEMCIHTCAMCVCVCVCVCACVCVSSKFLADSSKQNVMNMEVTKWISQGNVCVCVCVCMCVCVCVCLCVCVCECVLLFRTS